MAEPLAEPGPLAESTPLAGPGPLASALVGAWRLESTERHLADGSVAPSAIYGPDGIGYLLYAASGHMAVVLADPSRSPWGSTDDPTLDELREAHDHFVAYAGRCEVDEAEGLVVHHIEMHVTPNFVGDAARRVTIDGNRLTLDVLPDELPAGVLAYRFHWRRAD